MENVATKTIYIICQCQFQNRNQKKRYNDDFVSFPGKISDTCQEASECTYTRIDWPDFTRRLVQPICMNGINNNWNYILTLRMHNLLIMMGLSSPSTVHPQKSSTTLWFVSWIMGFSTLSIEDIILSGVITRWVLP